MIHLNLFTNLIKFDWFFRAALVIAILVPLPALSDLSFLDLKGVDALVNHLGASPISAYTTLQTQLENRRFLGNYGSPSALFGCMNGASKIHEQLVTKNDCPQDAMSEWLQRLFPSPDGSNFVANQIYSDPISHLTPECVGRVLQRLHEVRDEDWLVDSVMEELESQLAEILFQEVNPEGYRSKKLDRLRKELRAEEKKGKRSDGSRIVTIQSQLQSQLQSNLTEMTESTRSPVDLLELLRAVSPTGSEDSGSLESSWSELVEVSGSRSTSPVSHGSGSKNRGFGKERDFQELAKILVSALRESRRAVYPEIDPAYPKYLPEHALMAFFLKKANDKKDLIRLFNGMPRLIQDPAFLADPERQARFVAQKWSHSDYHPEKLLHEPEAAVEAFTRDPEFLVFSMMEERLNRQLPPRVNLGMSHHSSLEGTAYPDCGETSLRNFFNYVLYDPVQRRFDPLFFKKFESADPAVRFLPQLIRFYEENSNPASSSHQSVRDEWSQSVASAQPGVKYTKPLKGPFQCEMDEGVDNMLAVLDRLLHHRAPGDPGPLEKLTTRAEKLDQLCRSLSREGKMIQWGQYGAASESTSRSEVNSKNLNQKILFRINGKPSFVWIFSAGHFQMEPVSEVSGAWRDQVALELMERPEVAPVIPPFWFVTQKNLDRLSSRWISNAQIFGSIVYSIPLQSTIGKVAGFRQIVTAGKHRARAMKPLAERLKARVERLNDIHFLGKIHAALAEGGYPYHDASVGLLGHPDVKYERVSPDEVEKRFGPVAAQKMRRTWRRQGSDLAIGEPLVDQSGKELSFHFESAFRACLNLNPIEKRDEIEEKLRARDSKLSAFRKLSYSSAKEMESTLQAIHEQMPISGCYLMSREEWKIIESDLDAGGVVGEPRYVPQILPRLQGRWFWTSSEFPRDSSHAFSFSGITGEVSDETRHHDGAVRCACASPT
jgi:hypothetical protein